MGLCLGGYLIEKKIIYSTKNYQTMQILECLNPDHDIHKPYHIYRW